jgi:hypothetical protein
MTSGVKPITGISTGVWRTKPPIPHEHGAWVILYAPLLIAYGFAGNWASAGWLLLVTVVTGAFFAREAAGRLIRRRGKEGTTFWLGIYLFITAAAGVPLLRFYGLGPLLTVGGMVVGFFLLHSLLLVLPARKRLDRSQWGEILGVGALVMTGPAAYVVATGKLDVTAWLIWAGCNLYFSSGVFYVKMWLEAAKVKKEWDERAKRRVARENLLYHLLLTGSILALMVALRGQTSILLAIAFAPVLIRAFVGTAQLTNKLPNLKAVGLRETLYALWFTGFFLAALRCYP